MKRKLLFAALLAAGALGGQGLRAQAWQDVTDTYIENSDFESGTPITVGICTYARDMSSNSTTHFGMQSVNGWTANYPTDNTAGQDRGDLDAKAGGIFAINGGTWVGNTANKVPTTAADGSTSGQVLGLIGVWKGSAQYTQESKTELPVGTYLLVMDVYNTKADKFLVTNLNGVTVNGTSYNMPADSYANSWTKSVVKFNVTAAGKVTFSLGLNNGNVGVADAEALFIDNVKLYYAQEDVTADKTSKITNPKADTGNITGWTATGSNANEAKKVNGGNGFDGAKYFFEPSAWGDNSWNSTITQTINNLPEGFYTVQAAAQMSSGVTGYLTANGSRSSRFPANGTSKGTIASDGSVVAEGSGVAGWNYRDVTTYVGEDGTLTITAYSTASAKQNWANFDNFTLTFVGDELAALKIALANARTAAYNALNSEDYTSVTGLERSELSSAYTKTATVEETEPAYNAAYDQIIAATNTFTGAVASYATLATEKTYAASIGMTSEAIEAATPATLTGAEALNSLKVAEFTYVSETFTQDFTSTYLATPTTNTFDALDAQHWSGETHSYFDFWNANSADRELTYKITLPEGKYIIKAAGRGQANTDSNVSISDGTTTVNFTMKGDTGLGINKNGVTSFDASDAAGFANNNAGRGWEWRYLLMELTEKTEVTLSLKGHVQNSWIGACDFALLTTADNSAINKAAYEEALAAATAAQENTLYKNVQGSEKTALVKAIATDVSAGTPTVYDEAKAALESATADFIAAKDAYDSFATMYEAAGALAKVDNDNASANATYAEKVTENAVTITSTASSLATNKANIIEAATAYIAVASPTDDATFDLTFLLTNPDVTAFYTGAHGSKVDGWKTEQSDGNFQVIPSEGAANADGIHKYAYEYYYLNNNSTYANGLFNIYTSVSLPKGAYTMSCYAFAREANYTSASPKSAVYFYANDVQGSLIDAETLTEASISFAQKSEEATEVKIGLKPLEGNTYNWMGIGYVKLYKLAAAAAVELDESTENAIEEGVADVTVKKTIYSGWNTVVLPFGVDATTVTEQFGEGKLYKFSGYKEGTLNFAEATAIDPHTPYLFNCTAENATATGELKSLKFEGVTVSTGTPTTDSEKFSFVGTYSSLANGNTTIVAGDYVLGATSFNKAKGGNALKAFRAYVKNKTIETTEEVKSLVISIDGLTTAIEAIDGEKAAVNDAIYNLAGQRVEKAQRGIYIVNGKKVVVK